jgi:hypothetical protein
MPSPPLWVGGIFAGDNGDNLTSRRKHQAAVAPPAPAFDNLSKKQRQVRHADPKKTLKTLKTGVRKL